MTRQEYLLAQAAEECNEVAHRIMKALRFGLEDVCPGQPLTNAEMIRKEFDELCAVMDILGEEGVICWHANAETLFCKRKRVEEYFNYAHSKGVITE